MTKECSVLQFPFLYLLPLNLTCSSI